MLDPRVRTAIIEHQQGRLSLEEAAQILAQVHRETGCLTLYPSPSAGAAERALLARFGQLTEPGGGSAEGGTVPSSPH